MKATQNGALRSATNSKLVWLNLDIWIFGYLDIWIWVCLDEKLPWIHVYEEDERAVTNVLMGFGDKRILKSCELFCKACFLGMAAPCMHRAIFAFL